MTAHKHAELMAEYAKDALETDKPWERWEFSTTGGGCWSAPTQEITFLSGWEYRRKRTPLCQVEGKDVFAGDRLWHEGQRKWLVAERCSVMSDFIHCEEGYHVLIRYLSWSEPPKTKTVYQWAMRQTHTNIWYMTAGFYETEEAAARDSGDSTADFRRLDWTAMEVPCDD